MNIFHENVFFNHLPIIRLVLKVKNEIMTTKLIIEITQPFNK